MKTRIVKKSLALAFLLAGAAVSFTAKAFQQPETLGVSAVSVDAYNFACGTGTVTSQLRVFDPLTITNTAAVVFATFGKDNNPTLTVSAKENVPSNWIVNSVDGPGNYEVVVRKSAANKEDYIVEVQCLNSAGTVIGPSKLIFQINQ